MIVDLREFRSALPNLLHSRGMQLFPRTLEVLHLPSYFFSPKPCALSRQTNLSPYSASALPPYTLPPYSAHSRHPAHSRCLHCVGPPVLRARSTDGSTWCHGARARAAGPQSVHITCAAVKYSCWVPHSEHLACACSARACQIFLAGGPMRLGNFGGSLTQVGEAEASRLRVKLLRVGD